MSIYMCIYIYIYIHTMHVYMYAYICTCMNISVSVCVCACLSSVWDFHEIREGSRSKEDCMVEIAGFLLKG